jgi:hypothetical protein
MTKQQEQEAWALKVMELENGCVISAGNKTISDMLEMLRLQQGTRNAEPTTQNVPKSSRPRTVKPALSK